MPGKGKKSLPIDKETHALLKVLAARYDVTMYAFVREAFELYARKLSGESLDSPQRQAQAPRRGYPYPETKEWHEKLERVLTEGSERNRIGIEENLDWAVGNLSRSEDEELLMGKRTVNEKR